MAVGFQVGNQYYEIGTGDFLHSFFSTVAYHLERKKWGRKYPYLMKELYQGRLQNAHVKYAALELADIKEKLSQYPPSAVIWDAEDLKRQPPWGTDIAETITSLANYYITCEGEDFLEMLEKALDEAKETHEDITIQ